MYAVADKAARSKFVRFRGVLTTSMIVVVVSLVVTQSHAASSSITVDDILRYSIIGDPGYLDWRGGLGEPAVYSPDGARAVVIVRRGSPEDGTNKASLLLYDMQEIIGREDNKPRILVEFASSTNFQPLAFARWLNDNETVVFAGTQGRARTQIYLLNTRTGDMRPLTKFSEDLIWFEITAPGDRLIALTQREPRTPASDDVCISEGCRITATSLFEAQSGGLSRLTNIWNYDLQGNRADTVKAPEASDDTLNFCDATFAGGISPGGRFGVRLCRLKEQGIPQWWGDYTMTPTFRRCYESRNPRCWRRAFLVDFERGTTKRWTEAPLMPLYNAAAPIWIDDGRNLILPGAFEPLIGVNGAEREARASSLSVLLLTPETGRINSVARLDSGIARVASATWDQLGQTLTLDVRDTSGAPLDPVHYVRRIGGWRRTSRAPSTVDQGQPVRLKVEQSTQQRPVLVAVEAATGARKVLLDPNKWLDDRKFGKVEIVKWRTRKGVEWQGGLFFPPNFEPTHRYPLVIQTHGFNSNEYSLAGTSKGFPGQALAAHGVFVLQVGEKLTGAAGTAQELDTARDGYESAIDYLFDQGLIDRGRVGMIGWSATGPTVSYMLTHSEYPIAAVAHQDTGIYSPYLSTIYGAPQEIDALFGSAPFGLGLKPWLEKSPSLNLARVRSPVLMWSGQSVIATWDWYSGLRRLDRPVELWFSPESTHDPYQVGHRRRSLQLFVDWFRFWLQGDEDTDPARAEQYVRWRDMKRQQDVALQQPRPPLLEWSATPTSGLFEVGTESETKEIESFAVP